MAYRINNLIICSISLLILCASLVFGETKKIILYPDVSSFLYQEANNFLDSTKIIVGNNYIQFKPLRGNNRFGFDDPKGKKYSGAFNNSNAKVDVVRKKFTSKIEEFIIVKDSSLNNFQYKIKSNCQLIKVNGFINIVGLGYIDKPVAKDSIGQPVNVSMMLSGDTLTYAWSRNDSFPNIKLPIEIDPTVIIKPADAGMLDAYWQGGMQNNTELLLSDYYTASRSVYLRFPVLDSVPKGVPVTSVILSLYNVDNKNASPPTTGLLLSHVDTIWAENSAYRPKHDTTNRKVVMAMDTTDNHLFVMSSDSGATTNGIAADSLLNWTQRWVNLADSNYGLTIRYTNENSVSNNILRFASSSDATPSHYPSLTITYSNPIVVKADSLWFETLTDSTAKLLSIRIPSTGDTGNTNTYAIYDSSQGCYIDTVQGANRNKIKKSYRHSAWKNKTLWFPRNYQTRLIIMSDTTGSSKTQGYNLTLGTPSSGGVIDSGERAGRYNPVLRRPRRRL